jgi:hypothetical protein
MRWLAREEAGLFLVSGLAYPTVDEVLDIDSRTTADPSTSVAAATSAQDDKPQSTAQEDKLQSNAQDDDVEVKAPGSGRAP